jgi:putative tricarboxylic transport membrane protein
MLVTLLGITYTLATFNLPAAALGISYEPKVFPGVLGISLIILGTFLVIEEYKKSKTPEAKSKGNGIAFNKNAKEILTTLINGLLYTILFNRLGYVFSTIIFLEIQLWIFSGKAAIKRSTIVAVSFSLICYFLFTSLGIYLPVSPLEFI